MDVKLAADLYGQGWTLRQIAAKFGLTETAISYAPLVSSCVRAVLLVIPPPPSRSWNFATKVLPGMRWPNGSI